MSESQASIEQVITAHFDSPIRTVTRMSFGHANITYRVELADTTVIVRTNRDLSLYAGTIANLEMLRGLGFPVPRVLASDFSALRVPFAYLVTDAFAGRDLRFELESMTPAQMTRLAGQVVGIERRATARLPSGHDYGFLPIGGTGRHRRWIDAVRADRGRLAPPGDDLRPLIAGTYAALDRAERRLGAVAPTCFLDDLTIKNVIVYGGELQGIVDFDVVCYGDPMYWLALTRVAVLSDIGEPGRFYTDELLRLWEPTGAERANLALYSCLHGLEFLNWGASDLPRRDRLVNAVEQWLPRA